jgi:hypothetical protein
MHRYQVKAYDPDGAFAFGASLRCADDGAAKDGLARLPVDGRRAELYRGKRLVAARPAEAAEPQRKASRG